MCQAGTARLQHTHGEIDRGAARKAEKVACLRYDHVAYIGALQRLPASNEGAVFKGQNRLRARNPSADG